MEIMHLCLQIKKKENMTIKHGASTILLKYPFELNMALQQFTLQNFKTKQIAKQNFQILGCYSMILPKLLERSISGPRK